MARPELLWDGRGRPHAPRGQEMGASGQDGERVHMGGRAGRPGTVEPGAGPDHGAALSLSFPPRSPWLWGRGDGSVGHRGSPALRIRSGRVSSWRRSRGCGGCTSQLPVHPPPAPGPGSPRRALRSYHAASWMPAETLPMPRSQPPQGNGSQNRRRRGVLRPPEGRGAHGAGRGWLGGHGDGMGAHRPAGVSSRGTWCRTRGSAAGGRGTFGSRC